MTSHVEDSGSSARLSPFEPGPDGTQLFTAQGIKRAWVYSLPMRVKFRNITVREGLILQGRAGLAEAAPFDNYPPQVAATWFSGAFGVAAQGLPAQPSPVPPNVTVPVVDPDTAARLVRESGCGTAKVKVADPRSSLEDDIARIRAVRSALRAAGQIRVDANAAWSLAEAKTALPRLCEAAGPGGLQYAEQPCQTLNELVELQRATGIPVAADETIRLGGQLTEVIASGLAAAVIKAMPLGGPARAAALVADGLRTAAPGGTSAPLLVVSSALDTGVGLSAGLALATQLQTTAACGLGTLRLFTDSILTADPRLENGCLYPAKTLELKENLAPVSPAVSKRWRERVEQVAAVFARL